MPCLLKHVGGEGNRQQDCNVFRKSRGDGLGQEEPDDRRPRTDPNVDDEWLRAKKMVHLILVEVLAVNEVVVMRDAR